MIPYEYPECPHCHAMVGHTEGSICWACGRDMNEPGDGPELDPWGENEEPIEDGYPDSAVDDGSRSDETGSPEVRYFAEGAIDECNPPGYYWWAPAEPKQGPFETVEAARWAAHFRRRRDYRAWHRLRRKVQRGRI